MGSSAAAPAPPAAAPPPLGRHELSAAAKATLAGLRKNSAAGRLFALLADVDALGLHTRSTAGQLYHELTTAQADAQRDLQPPLHRMCPFPPYGGFKEAADGYTDGHMAEGGLDCSYLRRVESEGDAKYHFVRGGLWRFLVPVCEPKCPREMADTVLFYATNVAALRELGGGDSYDQDHGEEDVLSSYQDHGEEDVLIMRSAEDVRRRAPALRAWVFMRLKALDATRAHPLAGSYGWQREELMQEAMQEIRAMRKKGRISPEQESAARTRVRGAMREWACGRLRSRCRCPRGWRRSSRRSTRPGRLRGAGRSCARRSIGTPPIRATRGCATGGGAWYG